MSLDEIDRKYNVILNEVTKYEEDKETLEKEIMDLKDQRMTLEDEINEWEERLTDPSKIL